MRGNVARAVADFVHLAQLISIENALVHIVAYKDFPSQCLIAIT